MRGRAIITAAAALLLSAPPAAAEPSAPAAPQQCTPGIAGVATMPAGKSLPLICTDQRWQPTTTPGDPRERWLSLGPAMALHGEGLRNPNLLSGRWTGTPQDADSSCRAEQQAVISAGVLGAPEVTVGEPGQSVSLTIAPRLFSVEFSGHCLWVREQ